MIVVIWLLASHSPKAISETQAADYFMIYCKFIFSPFFPVSLAVELFGGGGVDVLFCVFCDFSLLNK